MAWGVNNDSVHLRDFRLVTFDYRVAGFGAFFNIGTAAVIWYLVKFTPPAQQT